MKRFVPILLSLAVLPPPFPAAAIKAARAASPTPASEAGAGAALAEAPTATEAPVPHAARFHRRPLSAFGQTPQPTSKRAGRLRGAHRRRICRRARGAAHPAISAALAAEVFCRIALQRACRGSKSPKTAP